MCIAAIVGGYEGNNRQDVSQTQNPTDNQRGNCGSICLYTNSTLFKEDSSIHDATNSGGSTLDSEMLRMQQYLVELARREEQLYSPLGRPEDTPEPTEVPVPTVQPTPVRAEVVVPTPIIPTSAPPASDGIISGQATHYGESYNGRPLGCGGTYYSSDTSIAAVSPARYQEWPCGTKLQICGPAGCLVVTRRDACPGCYANLIDLSESANRLVCGIPEHTCRVTIQLVSLPQ